MIGILLEWFVDYVASAVCVLFTIAMLALVTGVCIEFVQDYKSYDSRTACMIKHMGYQRQMFSSKVTCVPVPTRQDTTTVRVK